MVDTHRLSLSARGLGAADVTARSTESNEGRGVRAVACNSGDNQRARTKVQLDDVHSPGMGSRQEQTKDRPLLGICYGIIAPLSVSVLFLPSNRITKPFQYAIFISEGRDMLRNALVIVQSCAFV